MATETIDKSRDARTLNVNAATLQYSVKFYSANYNYYDVTIDFMSIKRVKQLQKID